MPLTSADITALSLLLDEALALPAALREAWLQALPEAQRHLGSALREMLAGASAAGPPLTLPWLGRAEALTRPGERVGPYRLLREIGRGGMGTVWLAERADGSFSRDVALKLPRGLWGEGLAHRMARERDIGARLEHPNIARLYDAGLDAQGRPYLALEYIDGQAIDAWCSARAMSVAEKLRLFVQVARAVAYAHGRLVVHRDLKPSNVLVTADGQVHLLDFGIAKLLQEDTGDAPGLTQQAGSLMTPLYAAPEQIAGDPVTVAADIYSLGVLLYELLTGTLPLRPRRNTRGALEDAILQGDAAAASSRVTEPATARALRGEVDAILAKAMKRDPAARYATADALAQDIEHHLRREPVSARPDSAGYRLRKHLWRHRMGLTAAAVVACALLGGAAAAWLQARRAHEAAERERVVKEFLVDVFRLDSAQRTDLRGLPARALLDHGAKIIDDHFPQPAPLQAELYGVVATIFADMGAGQEAERYAARQVATLRAIHAPDADVARALSLQARAAFDQQLYRESETLSRQAVALAAGDAALRLHAGLQAAAGLEKLGRVADADRELGAIESALGRAASAPSTDRALAWNLRARLLYVGNRSDAATRAYEAGVAEALAAEGPLSRTAIDIRLALAWNLLRHGHEAESRAPREAVLAALRKRGGADEIRAALVESDFASFLARGGWVPFEQARALVEGDRRFLAEAGPMVPASIAATVDLYLGLMCSQWGDVGEASRLVESAAARLHPPADALMPRRRLAMIRGIVAMSAGQHALADEQLRQGRDLLGQMGQGQTPSAAADGIRIAWNLGMQGRHAEALAAIDGMPASGVDRSEPGSKRQYDQTADVARARFLLAAGDPAAALQRLPPLDARSGRHESLAQDTGEMVRGEALCALKERAQGLARLQAVVDLYAPDSAPNNPWIARTRAVAGLCALSAGRAVLARQMARQAHAALSAQPGVSPYFRAPLVQLERALSERRGG